MTPLPRPPPFPGAGDVPGAELGSAEGAPLAPADGSAAGLGGAVGAAEGSAFALGFCSRRRAWRRASGDLDQHDRRPDLVVDDLRERGRRRHRRQRLIDVRLNVLGRERWRTLGEGAIHGDREERRGHSRAEQAPPPSTCSEAGSIDRATPPAAGDPVGLVHAIYPCLHPVGRWTLSFGRNPECPLRAIDASPETVQEMFDSGHDAGCGGAAVSRSIPTGRARTALR